jgi:hypothetical protein
MREDLKEFKKVFLILCITYGIVFICLVPLFFFGYKQYPLGVLVGSIVCLLNYYLLFRFADNITRSKGGMKEAIFWYIIRYLIYGAGITLCLLLQYFGYEIFSWISCSICYIIPVIVISIVQFKEKH